MRRKDTATTAPNARGESVVVEFPRKHRRFPVSPQQLGEALDHVEAKFGPAATLEIIRDLFEEFPAERRR